MRVISKTSVKYFPTTYMLLRPSLFKNKTSKVQSLPNLDMSFKTL